MATAAAHAQTTLPEFRRFNIDDEKTSLGIRWKVWLAEFENLLIALDITNAKRQRALMLYYAGNDVHEIYRSPVNTEDANEDFEPAKKKLTDYFEPKVNITYEIFHFRQTKQGFSDGKELVSEDERIDAFVTRLRKKAKRCSFTDSDEIKHQLIFGCKSARLRRIALQEDGITLTDLINKGRAYESSSRQATTIEEHGTKQLEVNRIQKPGKYSRRAELTVPEQKISGTHNCFSCGKPWPHPGGKTKCPAWGKECRKCNKKNHFASECKSRSKVNQVKDEKDESTDSSSSTGERFIYAECVTDERAQVGK